MEKGAFENQEFGRPVHENGDGRADVEVGNPRRQDASNPTPNGASLKAFRPDCTQPLEAERARQVKKDARKAQQKTPLEKNYLLSNSPGSVGPFKLGKTGSDGKKRAKEMQTGNHEKLTVVFEIACTDSYLIEKAAQHIFYDYRINDKLEWFDAPKDSSGQRAHFPRGNDRWAQAIGP